MIHNFNQDHPAIPRYDRGLFDVLRANERYDVRISSEYLNLASFEQEPLYIGRTIDYLAMKYSIWKPDAIVMDGAILPLFVTTLEKQFRDVPVFVPEANSALHHSPVPANMTIVDWGVSGTDIEKNIDLILTLRPRTKTIYGVLGRSTPERAILSHAVAVGKKYAGRVSLVLTDGLSHGEMLDMLSKVAPDAAILYMRFALDAAGEGFVPAKVLDEIVRRTQVPVFVMAEHLVGGGAIGGYARNLESLGRFMGHLIGESLGGRNPSGGRVVPGEDEEYVFDGRALARWGILDSRLPRGSRVAFTEPGFWERYRAYALAAIAVVVAETLLVAGLIVNRLRRKRAEAALTVLNTSLEQRVLDRTRELHDSNEALRQAKGDLETLNRQLAHMSRTDALTGLANRRRAEEILDERHREFERYGTLYSVAMLDIDFFKQVNDAHGHEAGDSLLAQLAADLAAGVRASDFVARWGGEEFLLVLPRTDAAAVRLLERIRGGIEARRYLFRDSTLSATATIGVATVRPGDTWDDVLRRCDAALYQGKAAGRNRVVSV